MLYINIYDQLKIFLCNGLTNPSCFIFLHRGSIVGFHRGPSRIHRGMHFPHSVGTLALHIYIYTPLTLGLAVTDRGFTGPPSHHMQSLSVWMAICIYTTTGYPVLSIAGFHRGSAFYCRGRTPICN